MKTPKDFQTTDTAYGYLVGKYSAYITAKAKLNGGYRTGDFFVSPEDFLLKIKELFKQGVGTNVYNNPILFLDQINKQGTPTDYFTHPNTANHLWGDLKNTVGDVEVISIDFLNFVDPTIEIKEKWKQSIQVATGIKPNNVEFVKLSSRNNVFARATYRASGHLLKFEICLPGPVWHDVTFNHAIVEGIPVFVDISLKAMGEMYDSLKVNIVEGEININELPGTEAAQKLKKAFMKQTEKTFTLYGSLDSVYSSALFNYLAIKYSDNVKWMLNPLTSMSNAVACLVMEAFDPKADGEALNKILGTETTDKFLTFNVIDSPDLPSMTIHDFNTRSQFIEKLPLFGFYPIQTGFINIGASSDFDKNSLSGVCTFIAPESLLFGPVIEQGGHLKVIDTSITVTSKILDTFVFPRNMYVSEIEQKIEDHKKELPKDMPLTEEVPYVFPSNRNRSNKYMFADTRTNSYNESFMSRNVKRTGSFELYQISQIIHDNPEYNVKSLRISSGMLREDLTRHYPLTGAKVQIKLGTHAYHDSLQALYREAFLGSKDYDSISYVVIPEDDGRYLHGALTTKTKCFCGLTLEDHKKTLCAYTENSLYMATNSDHKDISIAFFESLRILASNGYVFNNALEVKLLYCETILKDLIGNKVKYTTSAEEAKKVVKIISDVTTIIDYPIRVTNCDEKVIALCNVVDYASDPFDSENSTKTPSMHELMGLDEDGLLNAAKLYTLPCYENNSVTMNITNTPLMIYLLKYGKDLTFSQYYHSPSNNQEALVNALKLMTVHDLCRFAYIAVTSKPRNALYYSSAPTDKLIIDVVSKIYDDFNSQPYYKL